MCVVGVERFGQIAPPHGAWGPLHNPGGWYKQHLQYPPNSSLVLPRVRLLYQEGTRTTRLGYYQGYLSSDMEVKARLGSVLFTALRCCVQLSGGG